MQQHQLMRQARHTPLRAIHAGFLLQQRMPDDGLEVTQARLLTGWYATFAGQGGVEGWASDDVGRHSGIHEQQKIRGIRKVEMGRD